ncbi:hypothetical protein TRFO_18372 [Tritrichomonas foetus]|uniref:Uncharacterized protein n=1 Tax=Tritrichomonas foetus TaxID=1144522 RepID=A0A1J4KL81_9EUKA|nr:hypothetical protein TRFO_18372 [Tritrichomonas foetus]|eukprot:OHT11987.1 hypothetical protein TRFO_18372 [Tritrichomonas foetus]
MVPIKILGNSQQSEVTFHIDNAVADTTAFEIKDMTLKNSEMKINFPQNVNLISMTTIHSYDSSKVIPSIRTGSSILESQNPTIETKTLESQAFSVTNLENVKITQSIITNMNSRIVFSGDSCSVNQIDIEIRFDPSQLNNYPVLSTSSSKNIGTPNSIKLSIIAAAVDSNSDFIIADGLSNQSFCETWLNTVSLSYFDKKYCKANNDNTYTLYASKDGGNGGGGGENGSDDPGSNLPLIIGVVVAVVVVIIIIIVVVVCVRKHKSSFKSRSSTSSSNESASTVNSDSEI